MFFMAHCDATVDSSNDTVRVFLNTVDHKTVMCKLYNSGWCPRCNIEFVE